jgi:integrase/recombinase XerD
MLRSQKQEAGMGETNLYKREDVWWLRAQIDGHEYRESLRTPDVREARRLRDKRMKEIKLDVHHGEQRIDWFEAVTQWVRHAKGQIALATLKRYAYSLKMIEPHLAHLMVDKIDGKVIQALVQGRREGGAKPATVRRDLTAVSAVLGYAAALGQREGNPALEAARMLKERRDPIRLPTEDAIAAVTEAAGPYFGPLITAARLTGARQAELCELRWRDFNEEDGTLEIVAGKGNKRRVIKLSPAALAHFRSLPRHWEHIFCAADGKLFTNVRWDFQRYRRQARRRVTFTPFRFHDLRHYFAVEALRGGMGVYALSHHLGHGSVAVTEGYLTFLSGEQAQRAKMA